MQNLIFSCIESRIENDQNFYASFKLGPFYSNQGLTIANMLRRILLSNLEGLSIVFVKIEGVKHEYSILKGVQESVLEILMNLKQIQLTTNREIYKPQIAYLNVRGPKIIYSSDIQLPSQIQCVDPFQYIATLAADGLLKIKLFICQGKRYYLQESLKRIIKQKFKKYINSKIREYLFLDAIFLPVNKVNFIIEQNNELIKEFIILEIWTKSGVHPKLLIYKAINEAIQILTPFRVFKTSKTSSLLLPNYAFNKQNIKEKIRNKILNKVDFVQLQKKLLTLDIGNLNLSYQTYIYLKHLKINQVADIVKKSKNEFQNLKNFNPQILTDINSNLEQFGLSLKSD